MKTCNVCTVEKSLDDFYRDNSQKDKRTYTCKSCSRERAKKHWSGKTKQEKDKQYALNRDNSWKYRPLKASHEAKRRASKKSATPKWLTSEHIREIEDFYWLAKDLKSVTGEEYHVDHIIPLNNNRVSGLHVPWNLQILPSDVNIKKSNMVMKG